MLEFTKSVKLRYHNDICCIKGKQRHKGYFESTSNEGKTTMSEKENTLDGIQANQTFGEKKKSSELEDKAMDTIQNGNIKRKKQK